MTDQEIIQAFQDAGALLNGHFVLRSGLHSDQFFQAALLFRFPDLAEKLCRTLADRMTGLGAETVISPAVGGILVGQELARALGIQAIFADKENDQLALKRGFAIRKGEKLIIAEDVVTRGGRVQQTINLVRALGGVPVAAGVITDRSGGAVDFGIPLFSLLKLNLPTFAPADCPLCRAGQPLTRPGSGARS